MSHLVICSMIDAYRLHYYFPFQIKNECYSSAGKENVEPTHLFPQL